MTIKRHLRKWVGRTIFGCFLGVLGLLLGGIYNNNASAVDVNDGAAGVVDDGVVAVTAVSDATAVVAVADETSTADVTAPTYVADDNNESEIEENTEADSEETTEGSGNACKDSLGGVAWIACSVTDTMSGAVDWLYDKIQGLLAINPVELKDGEPIYELWKYFRGVTNIIFVIFLLVVIWSQLTGVGISNYGIKKVLPKLIVVAILVNLSYLICSLAVDVSNIVGNGLRGLFDSIAVATAGDSGVDNVTMAEMYASMSGGSALAVGGAVIALEQGAIWMLIPTVLGALVAVVTGLITIALRQAVVVLLIMIAPLAIVAYMLPNTDQWFKQWKQLFTKMLVFYPAFSLLFGASALAGWALMSSAKDGFWVILGMAVQIFPLVFSWQMMRMSGTFLTGINSWMQGLMAKPLAANRAWAESHRAMTQAKVLSSKNVYTPTARLSQFLMNRRVAREAETSEKMELAQKRGMAYAARRHYRSDGTLSRDGEEQAAQIAEGLRYEQEILRDKNNYDRGVSIAFNKKLARDAAQQARLDSLDDQLVKASDRLKVEQARTEKIGYDNAKGFYDRMEAAMNAHTDAEEGYEYEKDERGEYVLRNGKRVVVQKRGNYKFHFDPQSREYANAAERYQMVHATMEGSELDAHYAAATAAYSYEAQRRTYAAKMEEYFRLLPPTKDVVYRLNELTKNRFAGMNIDGIIPGLSVLAARGDTDLIREQIKNILSNSAEKEWSDEELEELAKNNFEGVGIHLGTHASQALASYLMFDVGDKDPALKRLGKYINLETAHAYNKNIRKNTRLTLDEYIKGYYEEYNPETGQVEIKKPNRGMITLLEGTSYDGVERTAYRNLDEMLMDAYRKADGTVDVKSYLARREEVETAIGPQFISASLKYLSGSEQLKSAVDFVTGRYRGNDRWMEGGELAPTEEEAAYAEEYFRRRTLKYIEDQTTTQIFGLRSDYRDPVANHLLATLFKEHPEAKREYDQEVARIQTLYGNEDAETAERKRKNDLRALRMKLAGKEMRTILDRSGKLEQIYRTRRSGGANNAKDWLRDWLLLNDEDEIYRYLDRKEQERKERHADDSQGDAGGVVSDRVRADNIAEMDRLYDRLRDKDEAIFRREARAKLADFAKGEGVLTEMFDKYIKEHGNVIDNYDLNEKIKMWLTDPENYK